MYCSVQYLNSAMGGAGSHDSQDSRNEVSPKLMLLRIQGILSDMGQQVFDIEHFLAAKPMQNINNKQLICLA